jgi:hypothetical protein
MNVSSSITIVAGEDVGIYFPVKILKNVKHDFPYRGAGMDSKIPTRGIDRDFRGSPVRKVEFTR